MDFTANNTPDPVVETLNRYQNTRGARLAAWSTSNESLFITTRFGNLSQIHRVDMPGGARHRLCQVVESPASLSRSNSGVGSCSVGTRNLSPVREPSVPKQTMMDCFQMFSTNAEQVLNLTVDTEKLLSLSY